MQVFKIDHKKNVVQYHEHSYRCYNIIILKTKSYASYLRGKKPNISIIFWTTKIRNTLENKSVLGLGVYSNVA